jgi:hypothetical protein
MDFKSIYYPGKLVVLSNELFNKQKITQNENNINYWHQYIERYFSPECVFSIIMSRENRTWTFSMIFINLKILVLKLYLLFLRLNLTKIYR